MLISNEWFRLFYILSMKYAFFLCFLLNYNVALAQYAPFSLKRNNSTSLSTFGESVNRINNNHEEALRIRNQIVSELRRIDLNEADDEWKTNYIDKYCCPIKIGID